MFYYDAASDSVCWALPGRPRMHDPANSFKVADMEQAPRHGLASQLVCAPEGVLSKFAHRVVSGRTPTSAGRRRSFRSPFGRGGSGDGAVRCGAVRCGAVHPPVLQRTDATSRTNPHALPLTPPGLALSLPINP